MGELLEGEMVASRVENLVARMVYYSVVVRVVGKEELWGLQMVS